MGVEDSDARNTISQPDTGTRYTPWILVGSKDCGQPQ